VRLPAGFTPTACAEVVPPADAMRMIVAGLQAMYRRFAPPLFSLRRLGDAQVWQQPSQLRRVSLCCDSHALFALLPTTPQGFTPQRSDLARRMGAEGVSAFPFVFDLRPECGRELCALVETCLEQQASLPSWSDVAGSRPVATRVRRCCTCDVCIPLPQWWCVCQSVPCG
jgi:hypothetical protein